MKSDDKKNKITSTLYIKNMVCERCKAAVVRELETQNISFQKVDLGEVLLNNELTSGQIHSFKQRIESLGFELIDRKESKLVERIKAEIIKAVHNKHQKIKTNFSKYLSENIGKEYSTISSLFSEVEGTTIEQYFILQKIERAKELLVYDELSLGQIADQLNYSSIQHLSNQFKKITGLTPSHFKKLGKNIRIPLDKV